MGCSTAGDPPIGHSDGGTTTGNSWFNGDLNGDGKVDDIDAGVFVALYGNGMDGGRLPSL